MEQSRKPNHLPKYAQIMYQRIPEELQRELDALPSAKMIRVLEALNKLHRTVEAEVYELAIHLIQAGH
jgi:uncharacterized protein YdeI (YjbR/CyaY-like superfamily)